MIEKNYEIKQGAAVAVLSAAVLAGSLYINQALDYRDAFIPGTVINGVKADGRTVAEMEEILGEYDLKVTFRNGKELSVSIGIAKGTEHDVSSVEELIKIADKKMYADKELFYSDDTHERRKR